MNIAIYLRSSKDKAEVSISAQRRELAEHAKAKGYVIVREFEDVEISGSLDEASRPGLRALLDAVRDPNRGWQRVLCLDTSRLARDAMISLYVQHECDKADIVVEFSKLNVDGSTAFGEMILTTLRAFDRLHARMSKEKGIAGLKENFYAGHRSGGSAPRGYKLLHTETGGTRGGKAVTKSRLVLDETRARQIQAYLRHRAAGGQRAASAKAVGLQDVPDTTLLGIERNALTYAGHAVWNQRKKLRPTKEEPRKGMVWRPRSEWMISDAPQHEALITRAEADAILADLDRRVRTKPGPASGVAQKPDAFWLSGLMFTPEGVAWQGEGIYYRAGRRGKYVRRDWVEAEVEAKLRAETGNRPFLARAVTEAHRVADSLQVDSTAVAATLAGVEQRIARVVDAVSMSGGSGTLLAKLADLEGQRAKLLQDLAEAQQRGRQASALRRITAKDIEAHWEFLSTSAKVDTKWARTTLSAAVARIEFDPKASTLRIDYHMALGKQTKRRAIMASPGGSVASPPVRWSATAPVRARWAG